MPVMCYPKYPKHNKTVATTLPLIGTKCLTLPHPLIPP